MAGLSSPGIGSGIDINSLVSKLMAAEAQPLAVLDKKEADYQAKLSAFGTLKGSMSSLQTAARALSSPSKFNSMTATAADTTILSASTTSIAKAGSYNIEVTQLAQAHKLAAGVVVDPTATVGTGTLTIDFGTYDSIGNTFSVNAAKTAKTIVIGATDGSLNGIRDAINNANAGVTASIINDGSGYRLTIGSKDSGADNSLRIVVSNDGDGNNTDTLGLSKIAYNPTAGVGTGKNLTETLAAKSATLKVDGISITKSTNSISDAIQGVTLNLLKTSVLNTPTTLTVASNSGDVVTAVNAFVTAYNATNKIMHDLGGYDPAKKQAGLLLGDATLRGMQSQLRALIGQNLGSAGGGLSALSDIGVAFQRDGSLALNATKLNTVLADSTKNVATLFAKIGVPSDSLISYVDSSAETPPGNYGINLTQIPVRGAAAGTFVLALTNTNVIDATNNTLTLSVDGTSANVTLNNGTYTADTLAAEIQARINSDFTLSGLGKLVTVSQTGGKLTVTSNSYGASSSVSITGGAGLPLFGTLTTTAGADVAGELGGVAGTGAGQILTGGGNASGLKLQILGGVTGARGTVGFDRGIGYQLDQTLTSLLASTGSISSRTDGINTSIKDIGSRRKDLNLRLAQIEKRYRAQFNALDSTVASMQSTSNYLSQQLANLSSLNK